MGNEEIKYLVFDCESVPDTKLIKNVKYSDVDIGEQSVTSRFQEEILENSGGLTTFIPVTFQLPISLVMLKAREDYSISEIVSLDEPNFRPREIVRQFWQAVEFMYKNASLVTFNGRGFDIPLMELMAFRYGITISRHFRDKFGTRYRFGTKHIDLQDLLSNFGAIKMAGGLNLLAKVLGKPGKIETTGDDVAAMYADGKVKEINDYCIFDVLDTYFVFLRTRVVLGEINRDREQQLLASAREFIRGTVEKIPALKLYLENWVDDETWP